MKRTVFYALIASLFFCSCNTNNQGGNKIPYVGENIDSVAIANDTASQKLLESSYEFAQTVIVSQNLVYDVRAYGGPASKGKFCVIRRGPDNKPDTVIEEKRDGIIVNSFTGDLNKNGKEEIYVVFRKPLKGSSSYLKAYEFDPAGKPEELLIAGNKNELTINSPIPYDTTKPFSDTIFIRENLLYKSYMHKSQYSPDALNYTWELKGNKFILVRND